MAIKNKRAVGGIVSAVVIAAAVAFVGPREGVELKAYRDIVGVKTICYGETQGVQMGDTATLEQCKTRLASRLAEFDIAMQKCLPPDLPVKTETAFLSFSYNLGPTILCSSQTMSRLIRAGDIAGACRAMVMFNRAGGKVVRGLKIRREAERDLCLEGLK